MMTRYLSAALAAFMFVLSSLVAAHAQSAPMRPSDAFALTIEEEGSGVVALHWDVADGYYMYRSKFAAEGGGSPLAMDIPAGEAYDDPYFGHEEIFREDVTMRLTAGQGPVIVHWQGCQQDGICYAPQKTEIQLASLDGVPENTPSGGAGGWRPTTSAADLRPSSGAVASAGDAPSVEGVEAVSPPALPSGNAAGGVVLAQDKGLIDGLAERGGSLLVIAGFFGFGLLLAFTPCVLPMVPIVAGMLSRQGEALTARRGLMLTGSYVLAMAGAFGLLGIVAAWSGANLQMVLQSPWAIGTVTALFVLLALSMFGVFTLQMPQAVQTRLSQVSGKRGSLGGAALLGFTSALIVGPCVTAPLAAALIYIAQSGDVLLGALALFALGLGQGVPLLAVGAFGPQVLPKGGPWMDGAKQTFGVVFLGFAIWMAGRILPGPAVLAAWSVLLIGTSVFLGALDRLDPATGNGRRLGAALGVMLLFAGLMQGIGAATGAQDPLRPLAGIVAGGPTGGAATQEANFATVRSPAQFDAALAAANGKPALLYVTADWCVTCRAIERGPLKDPAVVAALSDMAAIKVDVSEFDEDAQAVMDRLGAVGPPTMVFLDATRSEVSGSRLIGPLGSADLLASIGAAKR